jgi:hypothetical protein
VLRSPYVWWRPAGWQMFKQLLLESRRGGVQQASPPVVEGTSAATTSSVRPSPSQGPADDSQMRAMQDQLRKLRLQVCALLAAVVYKPGSLAARCCSLTATVVAAV